MTLNLESFRQTLVYDQRSTAKKLIADLILIEDSDAIAEEKQKKLGGILTFVVIGFFLFLFLGFFFPPLFILVAILALPLVILTVLWNRQKSRNIINERYEIPKLLIPKFLRDMQPEASVHLAVDFSDPKAKRKKVDTIPDPRRSKWKIDRYTDPWLRLEGQFLDHTRFQISITEFTIEKYGWKRSRSGKSKFKRKAKPKGLEVALMLQFSRNRYGAISMLQASLSEAIKLPNNARIKRLKVSDNRLLLAAKIPPASYARNADTQEVDHLVTQMFLSLYHGLNLAKQLSRTTS
ncbi:hypothetical protein C1752_00121 [Acaryochloris thomasi RCC1774]|uniref:Galanin n=1 Tax=Acaryochloris thomasi RCC1774 TaxID=1764569 RepID=A0A2W1JPH3_9CYAN|nr:hypothetical protein [Acaryochloris thomasi]PZD75213.1 hypothetical protein C1752_00121 [Acaryochloris thomasi RCC1774]